MEKVPWSIGKRTVGFALITVVAFWCRLLPQDQVANPQNVAWNTVISAGDPALSHGRQREPYRGFRLIGTGEIFRGQSHTYHTNVYRLEMRRLIWGGAHGDRGPAPRFFRWWSVDRTAAIGGVYCDVWQSYLGVVREYFGHAVIVFDKFHIIRHLIEAVDQVLGIESKSMPSPYQSF